MSTKSTLAHDDNFHLYEEGLDGTLHLELKGCEDFHVIKDPHGKVRVRVKLSEKIIDEIAKIASKPRSPNNPILK